MRRVAGPIAVVAAASLAAGLPAASGSPTPSPSLERLATGPTSPKALRAEASLRRLENRALGPHHAAEHAKVRGKIRRVKAARVRAGLRPVIPVSSRRRAARSLAVGEPAQVGRWGPRPDRALRRRARDPAAHGEAMLFLQEPTAVAYIYNPVTGSGHRVDPPVQPVVRGSGAARRRAHPRCGRARSTGPAATTSSASTRSGSSTRPRRPGPARSTCATAAGIRPRPGCRTGAC